MNITPLSHDKFKFSRDAISSEQLPCIHGPHTYEERHKHSQKNIELKKRRKGSRHQAVDRHGKSQEYCLSHGKCVGMVTVCGRGIPINTDDKL